ncbi:SCP-like extracellular protein [Phlyctema vagabunda]|uniref:SCP-like extracellular protein n=1 Tax=Phlyctema vagabunda TaxID=108571 RepID=A0ABR4P1E7_9HELO
MRSYTIVALFLASIPIVRSAAIAPTTFNLIGDPILAEEMPESLPRDIEDVTFTPEIEARAVPSDYNPTALKHHNAHRANHSAKALTYDAKLASYAASLASSCKFGHNRTAGGGGYGQNIAAYGSYGNVKALSPSTMLAKAITSMWYNSEYNAYLPSYYGKPTPDTSNFAAWGHLTQIVWASTTSVGCATQYCEAGTIYKPVASWYTVCNYKTPGNVVGSFDKNVLKSLRKPTLKGP